MHETIRCPQCGAENDAGNPACASCGTALVSGEPSARPALDQAAKRRLLARILQRMRAGADDGTIASELEKDGMGRDAAARTVQAVERVVAEASAAEEYAMSNLLGAIIGGLVAAAIGGALWGFIVIKTDHEIGVMAWGIGWLCGFAVLLLSGRRKGLPFQLTAVLASILGIAVGKYAAFYMVVKKLVLEKHGAEIASKVTVLSPGAIVAFLHMLPKLISPFDLLWIVLAVMTAWRIPRALGIRRPFQATPPPRIG